MYIHSTIFIITETNKHEGSDCLSKAEVLSSLPKCSCFHTNIFHLFGIWPQQPGRTCSSSCPWCSHIRWSLFAREQDSHLLRFRPTRICFALWSSSLTTLLSSICTAVAVKGGESQEGAVKLCLQIQGALDCLFPFSFFHKSPLQDVFAISSFHKPFQS